MTSWLWKSQSKTRLQESGLVGLIKSPKRTQKASWLRVPVMKQPQASRDSNPYIPWEDGIASFVEKHLSTPGRFGIERRNVSDNQSHMLLC